ncbi:HD-GYP domain-containing protein [Tepidibacter hydrothermalis]|uniref:HD domain-containing protein n=1 Tax=Tepidibacter hydrothermalis TaxID=3036126 RepID=A0ABY8E6Z9_9FIRM|nr:HD domain-containing phosphohydrolase [Tepidibacter hydrothermalis]WFD08657.1 HD domain-containing protein [Tepidibacter hydrothermalis]
MIDNKICFIILFSSVIMLINIIQYRKVLKHSLFFNNKTIKISLLIKFNLMMMIIFFVGYIVVAGFVINHIYIKNLLIAVIFLGGSVFVFSVIIVQIRLSEIGHKIYSFDTVKALVNTIEARDPYTRGHSQHVANLCICIYEHLPKLYSMKINKDMLKYAGYLHDIGKIGIPEHILQKKGKLTYEEYETMKTHPIMGKNIIKANVLFAKISDWVYYHHEHIDGNGYFGIKGNDIPIESKIIGIADCFSALVTDRVYRKGKTYEEAIKIMNDVSGTQLDSEILDTFMNIDITKIEQCKPSSL